MQSNAEGRRERRDTGDLGWLQIIVLSHRLALPDFLESKAILILIPCSSAAAGDIDLITHGLYSYSSLLTLLCNTVLLYKNVTYCILSLSLCECETSTMMIKSQRCEDSCEPFRFRLTLVKLLNWVFKLGLYR